MFAEDRFGRRLKFEREQRGMTQADVAGVLQAEHGLKLHPTAIAKMEQRDVDKPRAIRLYEARAIADVFGLTVDEMMSTGNSQIEALAREFMQLGSQAEALRERTGELFDELRSLGSIMIVPEEQVTPELRLYRAQIIRALATMQSTDEARMLKAESLLDEVTEGSKRLVSDDLAAQPAGAMASTAADRHADRLQEGETIGQRLRRARENADMTLEEVYQLTRIRPSVVAAIERDEFTSAADVEPRDEYVRGRIQTLARAFGVDAAPLLARYDAEHRGRPTPSPSRRVVRRKETEEG